MTKQQTLPEKENFKCGNIIQTLSPELRRQNNIVYNALRCRVPSGLGSKSCQTSPHYLAITRLTQIMEQVLECICVSSTQVLEYFILTHQPHQSPTPTRPLQQFEELPIRI